MSVDIKVLGPGCRNCIALDRAARSAVEQLGIDATVEKVEDYGQIAAYNIMSTPGLVVNGQVVSAGRVLTAHSIKELILRATA